MQNQEDKDKQSISDAKNKIQKALMRFYINDPVMLGVYCLLEKHPNPKQETIGINTIGSNPILEYNPYWINAVSDEVVETVLASEGLKILLRHCTSRLKDPKEISSLSSSITINELLKYSFEKIISGSNTPTAEMFNLPNDLCFEEYYRELKERCDEIDKTINEIWNKNDDTSDKSSEQQQQYVKYENGKDALKEYFNPNGTSNDNWKSNEMLDLDIELFVSNNRKNIASWGSYTGDAMDKILAANSAKISYKEVLRRFNRSVTNELYKRSRMKVNRRYDLLFPGHRRTYQSNIIFAIDVSGSMENEDIAEGLAVINSCCKHANITYITFDTEIKHIEKNYKKINKDFKLNGRGGTDPECILEYASKNKCDGVVIFSDMYFRSNIKQPVGIKVLWLSHVKGQRSPVSWGFNAELNRKESH